MLQDGHEHLDGARGSDGSHTWSSHRAHLVECSVGQGLALAEYAKELTSVGATMSLQK